MRAILTVLAAAALILAGCAEAPPPPQHIMAPMPALAPPYPAPMIGEAPPPLPGPRAGPSLRYRAYKPKQHCQIRTHTTTNKAGVKRTAKYRVCLK